MHQFRTVHKAKVKALFLANMEAIIWGLWEHDNKIHNKNQKLGPPSMFKSKSNYKVLPWSDKDGSAQGFPSCLYQRQFVTHASHQRAIQCRVVSTNSYTR